MNIHKIVAGHGT